MNSMDYNEDLILDAGDEIRDWRGRQSISNIFSIVKLSEKILRILNKVNVTEPDFLFKDENLSKESAIVLELLLSGNKYEELFVENNKVLDLFVDNIVDEGYFLCHEIIKSGENNEL